VFAKKNLVKIEEENEKKEEEVKSYKGKTDR